MERVARGVLPCIVITMVAIYLIVFALDFWNYQMNRLRPLYQFAFRCHPV